MASYEQHSQQSHPFSLFTNLFTWTSCIIYVCPSCDYLRVAALLSPLPYGQDIVAVLGIVMFDHELIMMAEYDL